MEGLQQQHRRLPRKPASNGSEAVFPSGGRAGSKWSNPPKPHDYAEIFGGLAASCSIPVLNLPPVSDGGLAAAAASTRSSKLDYLDIFGGFRAGDFGASYEELFPVKAENKESKTAASNKDRSLKERGTKLQSNLFNGSTVKDQNRGNAASIKVDQSSNYKVSEKSSSDSTKTRSQTAKHEAANGSMHFDESVSVSTVAFSIDPTQLSSRKNSYSAVPVNHKIENDVTTVADSNLEDTSNLVKPLQNRMNDVTNEVKPLQNRMNDVTNEVKPLQNRMNDVTNEITCREEPSLSEMPAVDDNPSNEQYHSCSSSDQSSVEEEDVSSVQSNITKSMNYKITDGVTVDSHLDKIASSSPTSSCATIFEKTFQADQLNVNTSFKDPQTAASFEDLHLKATNNQFQPSGDGKHSVTFQSTSNCSQSLDINDRAAKEDIISTLFSNTEVSEHDSEMGQKQFQHIDTPFCGRAADGRHLTHSFSSVSSPSEFKYDVENKFLTVLDINLRTVPCKVPPPSRPPPSRPAPKPASTQGKTGATVHMKNILSGAFETEVVIETSKDGQTDCEDATSATAASIAVKEAMEQAAAKLKMAKESMERKKDNLQQRKKLGKIHSNQDTERDVDDAPQLAQLSEFQQSTEKLSSKIDDAVSDEKTNAAFSDIPAPESNSVEELKKDAHDKISDLNQVSCMQDENIGKWKIEEQFVELVNSEKRFKKVKAISGNTTKRPKTPVYVVSADSQTQMEDENDVKASLGVHVSMTNDLFEVSESSGLEKNNDNLDEAQVPVQMKKTDAKCFTSCSDILVPEREDMMKEDSRSCQKENEMPQTSLRVNNSELEVQVTEKDPNSCNPSEENSKSSRDNACEVMASKLASNEKELDSIHEMNQTDINKDGINSSEMNCKTCSDDMNMKAPEPVEFSENPIEVELPSTTRVRKKWNIPKFPEGSILATEKTYDQGEIELISEAEIATNQDDPKMVNENLETCEMNTKDSGNREEREHKSDAVEEGSTCTNTDMENATRDEVNWQYFCEKIIRETEEEPQQSGQEQEAAEVDAKSKVVEEEQFSGQGCNKTGIDGESASSFQDAGRHNFVKDASQSVENEVLEDGEKACLFKHHANEISCPEKTLESQNLEGTVEKLPENCKAARVQEERILKDDKLKRDTENKLEDETEKQQRKLEEEREKERERKLEEEREREREREKDRQAVERAIRESRERAERAAVERVTAEARQRALAEAREKAEKASAEALLQAEKASREARLRAERAAVERATAEARERAAERALAEKAALEAKERSNSISRDWNKREGGVEGVAKVGSKAELAVKRSISSSDLRESTHGTLRYSYSSNSVSYATEKVGGNEGESAIRCKARLERHQRTVERAAKALAEKNMRDILAQREQAERNRLAEVLDAEVRRWSSGKEGNLRALLSTLQYILGPESGWQPIPLTEVITAAAVKKAYRKATLCVHPDKLQQRGASIQQKYICEKVFDLLKEAWNRFNSEER